MRSYNCFNYKSAILDGFIVVKINMLSFEKRDGKIISILN